MKVTKSWLQANRTSRGGWTKAQADILGLDYPLKKGWQQRIINKEISDFDARRFEMAKQSSYNGIQKLMNAYSRLSKPEREIFKLWLNR